MNIDENDLIRAENKQLRDQYAELHRGLVNLTERNVMLTQMLCATVYEHCDEGLGALTVTPELLDTVRDFCGFRLRTTYVPRKNGDKEVELRLEPLSPEESEALKQAIGAMEAVAKLAKSAAHGTTDEKPPRLDGSDAQN